jgi:hypothetical protein
MLGELDGLHDPIRMSIQHDGTTHSHKRRMRRCRRDMRAAALHVATLNARTDGNGWGMLNGARQTLSGCSAAGGVWTSVTAAWITPALAPVSGRTPPSSLGEMSAPPPPPPPPNNNNNNNNNMLDQRSNAGPFEDDGERRS